MRNILGISLIAIGVVLALYVGGWLLFIVPIASIITAIFNGAVTFSLIAFSILKIVCASFIGWLTFILFATVGGTLMDE